MDYKIRSHTVNIMMILYLSLSLSLSLSPSLGLHIRSFLKSNLRHGNLALDKHNIIFPPVVTHRHLLLHFPLPSLTNHHALSYFTSCICILLPAASPRM